MFGCRILYQLYTTHLSDLKLSSTRRREVLTPSNDVVVGPNVVVTVVPVEPSICQLACTLVEPIEHRDVGVSRGMHYSIHYVPVCRVVNMDHQRCVVRRLIALRARRRRTCSENSCHNLSCLDTTRLVLTDIIMVKCLCML